jgi:hypothetical protein
LVLDRFWVFSGHKCQVVGLSAELFNNNPLCFHLIK